MVRMRVVDSNGESSMDEDQWEAASTSNCTSFAKLFLTDYSDIYIAFAFEKR